MSDLDGCHPRLTFSVIHDRLCNWTSTVLYSTLLQLEGVIMAGVDIDQKCRDDVNAIFFLLQRCSLGSSPEKIQLLLQHKADLDARQDGQTALELINTLVNAASCFEIERDRWRIQCLLQEAEGG